MVAFVLALVLTCSCWAQPITLPIATQDPEAEEAAFRRLTLYDAARLRETAWRLSALESRVRALERRDRRRATRTTAAAAPPQQTPEERAHQLFVEGVAKIQADAEAERQAWQPRPPPAPLPIPESSMRDPWAQPTPSSSLPAPRVAPRLSVPLPVFSGKTVTFPAW